MATYTERKAVDQIIAGDGHTIDDTGADEMPVKQITEYRTVEGGTLWGVSFISDPENYYAASPFVLNPKTIFTHNTETCDRCKQWKQAENLAMSEVLDEIEGRKAEILADTERAIEPVIIGGGASPRGLSHLVGVCLLCLQKAALTSIKGQGFYYCETDQVFWDQSSDRHFFQSGNEFDTAESEKNEAMLSAYAYIEEQIHAIYNSIAELIAAIHESRQGGGKEARNEARSVIKTFLEMRKAEIMDAARAKFATEGRGFLGLIISDSGQHSMAYVNQFAERQLVATGGMPEDKVITSMVHVYDPESQAVVHAAYHKYFARFVLSTEDVTEAAQALDEIGERQVEILTMDAAALDVLRQQLTQRALHHGFNLTPASDAGTYNLIDRRNGDLFELPNMTLFQVEEALDGITTKEDLEHADRN